MRGRVDTFDGFFNAAFLLSRITLKASKDKFGKKYETG